MSKIISKIVGHLIAAKIINDEEKELYEFAFFSLILNGTPIILTVIIGAFFKIPFESLIFICTFLMIRKFSGGYHAKNIGVCAIESSFVITGTLITAVNTSGEFSELITIITTGIILLIGPIDNGNKPLTIREKKLCKKILFGILIFIVATGEVIEYTCQIRLLKFISSAIVLVLLLQVLEIARRLLLQKDQK